MVYYNLLLFDMDINIFINIKMRKERKEVMK